jgi:hypothetical protein
MGDIARLCQTHRRPCRRLEFAHRTEYTWLYGQVSMQVVRPGTHPRRRRCTSQRDGREMSQVRYVGNRDATRSRGAKGAKR